MKTRKQKVICRVLCMVVSILLLASFFVVPVSAVDILTKFEIENIMYEYGSDPHDPEQRPYSSLLLYDDNFETRNFSILNSVTSYDADGVTLPDAIDTTSTSYMEFMFSDLEKTGNFGIYYINQLFDDGVLRTFSPGDTLFIDGSFFGSWTLDDSIISKGRFTLRDNGEEYAFQYGRVVAFTDTLELDINEDSEGLTYPRLAFHFNTEISSRELCLCFEFYVDAPSYETFIGFEYTKFLVEFGPGVSPNYPIFPSAPGKDEVDGFGSAEQELIGSQEQGMQEGLNVITDTEDILLDLDTSLKLGAFTGQLSGILDRIVSIPGLNALVHISMALGLFASLMALAASIVHAADRKAGQAKREAAREANRDKKK